MVLDLSKLEHISHLTFSLTGQTETIYFLIYVDEKTPRYKRVGGEYHLHPQGKYVFDFYDVLERKPRVLKYIGESISPAKRISEHYLCSEKDIHGTGPVFNYVRRFKFKKRFIYDNVRITEETKLVQKFIPELNLNSQFNDVYKAIMLNSEGRVKPQDLMFPFILHARDVYQAFRAWEKEDQNYIDTALSPADEGWEKSNKKNKPISYFLNGKKRAFGRFFRDIVMRRHKKQVETFQIYQKNLKIWTEMYAPDVYEERRERAKKYHKEYYEKNKKNNNQQELKFT